MSVSCTFGMTESGKSFHVMNKVIPNWSRVIVFDPAHCFKDGEVIYQPSDAKIMKLLETLHKRHSYRIIIRPEGRGGRLVLFDKIAELCFTLGDALGKDAKKEDRVQFVVDEADSICNSQNKSEPLHHLVNEARHQNVDCHFISRVPTSIHTDIRRNCSKITCFFLSNASEIPDFKTKFKLHLARKIEELDKYWYLEWKDNGEIILVNDKGQIQQNFSKKSSEIQSKMKRAA